MYKRLLIAALLALTSAAALAQGSPSEAFMEYHQALKRSLGESGLWPHITRASREDFERKYSEQVRGKVFYMMKTTAPSQIRIEAQQINGGTATLSLVGAEGGNMVGTATLQLEDNQWRVDKVVWQSR